MSTNRAAWIAGPKVTPLEIKAAPYPVPGPKDVVIKSAFVAINPLEYKIQDYNPAIGGREMQYPTILGADLAGTIVEIGSDVKIRKIGDRVTSNCSGAQTGQPARGAFQLFVLQAAAMTTPVPDEVPLEAAVVLPLAMDTAFAGLFGTNGLGLSTAKLGGEGSPPLPNSVLLVWGGSSSVGCCGIQMAVAAGYRVYTTASKRNHDLCSSIGASKVFDHSDPDVEKHMIEGLKGKTVAGALDCVVDAEMTMTPLARILAQATGTRKIATVLNPPQEQYEGGVEAVRLSIPAFRQSKLNAVTHTWMARALADGSLKPKPDSMMVGEGLESIQAGIDKLRGGVSAMKVVAKL